MLLLVSLGTWFSSLSSSSSSPDEGRSQLNGEGGWDDRRNDVASALMIGVLNDEVESGVPIAAVRGVVCSTEVLV